MKRRFTLLAMLISGLLVASAVEAGPMLWLQQLMGMGADVTTMTGGAGGGPGGTPGYGYGPYGGGGKSFDAVAEGSGRGYGRGYGDGYGGGYNPYSSSPEATAQGQGGEGKSFAWRGFK